MNITFNDEDTPRDYQNCFLTNGQRLILFLSDTVMVFDTNQGLKEISRTLIDELADPIDFLDCCSVGIQYIEDHSFIAALFLDQEKLIIEDEDI